MKTSDFNRHDAVRHNRVRGAAWLLSIFGIFGVCLFLAWLVGKDNGPLSSHGDRFAKESMYSPSALHLGRYSKGTKQRGSAPQTMLTFVYFEEPASVSLPGADVRNKVAVPSKLSASAASASAGSTNAYDDRIEREAREVLRGDYGNNPGRQKSLGSDYSAVQARVNQILGR